MSEVKQDTLSIDGVDYHFSEADVFKAKRNAELLLSLAKGAVKIGAKGAGQEGFDINIDPAEILSNIATPEAEKVQDFIWSTVKVTLDGQGVPFTSNADRSMHLGKYRSHIYQIILFGAKFHFLAFLPTGEEFAKSILGQAMNKAMANLT